MAGYYARRRRIGAKRHRRAAIVYGAALTGLALLFSAAGPSATATVTVGPAGSAPAAASASLSELSIPAGSEATVSANGFRPGSAVRMQIGTKPAGASVVVAVAASGNVNTALGVPAGSRPGWDDVVLRGVARDGHPLVEELALQVTRPRQGRRLLLP